MLNVVLGRVPGLVPVEKFGRSINVDQEPSDIWDGNDLAANRKIYAPAEYPQKFEIFSSSAEDSISGDGAQIVRLFGLINWDHDPVQEDVEMAGNTRVQTVNDFVMVYRMEVIQYGDLDPNANNIALLAV